VLVVKRDFLRNIVNPILNEHVERGMPIKVASEIRKLVLQAENKYKFSVFGGDPRNLKLYLNSEEFSELVKFLATSGYRDVLLRILEETREAYSELEDVRLAVESAIRSISREDGFKDTSETSELSIGINELAETIRKRLGIDHVEVSKKSIKLLVNDNIELRLRVFKGKLKLEVVVRKLIERSTPEGLLEVIGKLVEKARHI